MTNLFGFNTTVNEDSTIDGIVFVSKTISPSLEAHLNKASEVNDSLYKKAQLPTWLRAIQFILFLGAVIFTVSILRAGISLAYKNAPFLVICTPILWVFYIIIKIYESMRFKSTLQSDELKDHAANTDDLFRMARMELGIPEDYIDIDVLCTRYKIKNNEVKNLPCGLCSHINVNRMMYVEKGVLCLATIYDVMEIPLSSLGNITYNKKSSERARFPNWNKEDGYDSEKYKKFKIAANNQGAYFCTYYSVEIHDSKGNFFLLIPAYDFEAFSQLTGVHFEHADF